MLSITHCEGFWHIVRKHCHDYEFKPDYNNNGNTSIVGISLKIQTQRINKQNRLA